MARQKTVVDASVVVKWFAQEKGTDRALALLDQHDAEDILLIVPDSMFSEVLNSLRYKGGNEKALLEANAKLWNAQLKVEPTQSSLLEQACRIALANDLSIYDAVYYAVSVLHGAPLVTEDKKLLRLPNARPL